MAFVGDPYQDLSPTKDPRIWRTTRVLRWDSPDIRVPRRFATDGATILRPLWPLIGHPLGKYHPAAILHDYLYATHETSRAEADRVLREACRELGVAWWRRWAMWAGVRAFGWVMWSRGAS